VFWANSGTSNPLVGLGKMVAVCGPGTSVSRAATSHLRDGALIPAEHLTDLGRVIAQCFGRKHRVERVRTQVVAASVVDSPRPALDIARAEQRVTGTNDPAGESQRLFCTVYANWCVVPVYFGLGHVLKCWLNRCYHRPAFCWLAVPTAPPSS